MKKLVAASLFVLFCAPLPTKASPGKRIGVMAKLRHWNKNRQRLSDALPHVDGLKSRTQRMRDAMQVYKDPRATSAHKAAALRVMRATYASALGWSVYNNASDVRHTGVVDKGTKRAHDTLKSAFGFVIRPRTVLKVAKDDLAKDKALRREAGVPLGLLTKRQPEDGLRNRLSVFGSTSRVKAKLQRVNSLIKEANDKLAQMPAK